MGGWRREGEDEDEDDDDDKTHRSRRALPGSVEAQRRWRRAFTTSVGEKDLMTKNRACVCWCRVI